MQQMCEKNSKHGFLYNKVLFQDEISKVYTTLIQTISTVAVN